MTHTLGPWIVDKSEYRGDIRIRDSAGWLIAEIGHRAEKTTQRANARLIAAAPDLLAALLLVARGWGNLDEMTDAEFASWNRHSADEEEQQMWRKVRDAIAKAKGEA